MKSLKRKCPYCNKDCPSNCHKRDPDFDSVCENYLIDILEQQSNKDL